MLESLKRVLLLTSLVLFPANAMSAAQSRPDIVMFIADDMSIKDSSAYGTGKSRGRTWRH